MTLSGAIYALGYLAGLAAFVLMARRRRLLTDGVMSLLAIGLLSGLLCANLSQWLIERTPGKSVLGAIVGGYLAVVLGKHILGIRRPLGDLFAVAITAGEAVGRWGCFFAGCCYGRSCSLPWAIWQHDRWRHPTQIYLSMASLLILFALIAFERVKPPENGIFYLQGILYCLARFVIEFAREGKSFYFNLTAAQWACIIGFVFFTVRFHVVMVNRYPALARKAVSGPPLPPNEVRKEHNAGSTQI